jgi:hypothetical protein
MGISKRRKLPRGLTCPRPKAPADIRCPEPAAGLREEQRRHRLGRHVERRTSPRQVALERAERVLSGWDDARLATFAFDPHGLGVEVNGTQIE